MENPVTVGSIKGHKHAQWKGGMVGVWANFTLGSNSVKGKARPNILYE